VIDSPTPAHSETDAVDQPEIYFAAGLVGFPTARRFLLEQGEGGVFELHGVDSEDPDFVVVAPAPFLRDYAPVIDDETVERLDLRAQEDALVLLVVTLGDHPEDATANTLAPLVVNARTREAAQVVLADQSFSLRQRLLAS
jgi:flagellar assembly factor FliW